MLPPCAARSAGRSSSLPRAHRRRRRAGAARPRSAGAGRSRAEPPARVCGRAARGPALSASLYCGSAAPRRRLAGAALVAAGDVLTCQADHSRRESARTSAPERRARVSRQRNRARKGSRAGSWADSARTRSRSAEARRASSRGSRSTGTQTWTLTFSSSFFRARDSRVETAVGLIPSTRAASSPSRSSRIAERDHLALARAEPARAASRSGDNPSAKEASTCSGVAVRSSRLFRRSSERNQSSAVVRAIWQSHVRALPRGRRSAPEPQRLLERVRGEVLGERAVAGQIDEIAVHVVEVLLCGRSKRGRQGRLASCRKGHRLHTVSTPPDGARHTCCADSNSCSQRSSRTCSSSRATLCAASVSMSPQSSASRARVGDLQLARLDRVRLLELAGAAAWAARVSPSPCAPSGSPAPARPRRRGCVPVKSPVTRASPATAAPLVWFGVLFIGAPLRHRSHLRCACTRAAGRADPGGNVEK